VAVIFGLVYYVTLADKPTTGVLSQADAISAELATAQRIARVGTVELKLATGPRLPASGEQVYKAQCAACHDTGAVGAPKFGDIGAWSARLGQGYDALLASTLKGKGSMPAQGGGNFSDYEIGRALVFMVNASGGNFTEPVAPEGTAAPDAAAPAATAAAAPAATPTAVAAVVAAPAAAPAAPAVTVAAAGGGEALYKKACMACHVAGVAGAPKLGDKAGWSARLGRGVDGLTANVIKGMGAMPPKGGAATASDAEIKAAVEFMVASVK